MPSSHRAVLFVLCLAAFTINVATSIAYVSLPTLTRELDASSRDLLWIVDAFNLAFAALVLAAGSLSDRFGRKGALLIGLAVYVGASLMCAWSDSPTELIVWRAVAGISSAIIFPTTLSLISNVFSARSERAKAIGLWGAATGVAIAAGPIVGGALLDSYSWGSAFVFCAALGAVTFVLAVWLVPTSRDPAAPPLDILGLLLSTAGLAALVYTIIEAPEHGWASTGTLAGFLVAVLVLAAFAVWERRHEHPMLDVTLFANLRFTAASGAVTFAFFATFGFVFLIAQYFQFVLGYDPLEAGLRQIPVALSVAVTSLLGTHLAVRFGTKAVVVSGLLIFAGGFVWTSSVGSDTSYLTIALQMILIGSGLGLTSAPATEAIMGVVPAAKAGIGSAVNDATRELGGTLGVAVIGSIAVSIYRDEVADAVPGGPVRDLAQESLGAAGVAAAQTGDPSLLMHAQGGFLSGLSAGCFVAAGVALVGALLVARYLPAHPVAQDDIAEKAQTASTSPPHRHVETDGQPGAFAGDSLTAPQLRLLAHSQALAHPIRQQLIMQLLATSVSSPPALADALGHPLEVASHHVRRLLELGIIESLATSRVDGTLRHHYSLTPTARDGLRSLLAAADIEPHRDRRVAPCSPADDAQYV